MAIAAILAMVHDVIVSVGIYSIFQFLVTPATVIAFLTILGYSLYDTIVVFDRIRENEARFLAQKPPYDDVINVSMNQVLMRSIMTTFSSVIPVLSMLVVGAWIMGQTTLEEFGAGAVHRPHHGCLLVVVHRRAVARVSQEDRQQLEDAHGAARHRRGVA